MANECLRAENKKLIDRTSDCVEEVVRWKRIAKEAKDEMEATEEREKASSKIVENLESKSQRAQW